MLSCNSISPRVPVNPAVNCETIFSLVDSLPGQCQSRKLRVDFTNLEILPRNPEFTGIVSLTGRPNENAASAQEALPKKSKRRQPCLTRFVCRPSL